MTALTSKGRQQGGNVTDCPAYLILSFLFRPLVLLPSVTPGRFAPFAY